MSFSNDYQSTERLQARLEETEADLGRAQERVALLETEAAALGDLINDVTVRLGSKGRDGDDLLDAVDQLDRFLEGRELDVTCSELSGVACQLRRLIDWSHVGVRSLCSLIYVADGVSDGLPTGFEPRLAVVFNEPVGPQLVYGLISDQPLSGIVHVLGPVTALADMINDHEAIGANR